MFKNLLVFKIGDDWKSPSASSVEAQLQRGQFIPCGATQKESVGWVSPRPVDHSPMLEVIGGQWLFRIQIERKSVPGPVLKKELNKRLKKYEDETGRKPGRALKKELKVEVEQDLLPRAFAKSSSVLVWLAPKERLLMVGTTSSKTADTILSKLIEVFSEAGAVLPVALLQTNQSPSAAMAQWLVDREAPAGFSIDRDLEMCQPDSEKSVVRYTRHNLDIDEVVHHIKGGKVPLKIALTWQSRVSFQLCSDMSLRKIELLDVVTDERDENGDLFDGDAALFTGELEKLIPELVQALGGEQPA